MNQAIRTIRVPRSIGSRSRFLSTSSNTITTAKPSRLPKDGLCLQDFVAMSLPSSVAAATSHPLTWKAPSQENPASFHIKTYGCQMNVSDSDIVRSLLLDAGLTETVEESDADLLLTNTCAIREGAEAKVWQRLAEIRAKRRKVPKKERNRVLVGVLGCMAERLKEDLLKDGMADLVVGPDAYRDLPRLIQQVWESDEKLPEYAVNVQLSLDETYADITPVRRNPDDVSAFVSIQRGCANRCSFCIVPFTRGQERSRPLTSIVEEIRRLVQEEQVKEVVLLGQNVNSYHDTSDAAMEERPSSEYTMSNEGFRSRIKRTSGGYYFADLVEQVSDLSPELRVRFTSPHPKDYPTALLDLMAERHNVCNQLHMPAQSGSTSMLRRMKRGYSREAYLELVLGSVLPRIPDVAITSDFITGFCGETEEEHQDTLSLMEQVRYDQAFMFAYSMREKTHAHRTMQDDVPDEVKQRRLEEIIEVFRRNVQLKNLEQEVGRYRCVLVEGHSKRRAEDGTLLWHGRTDQNKRILFAGADSAGDVTQDQEQISCWTDDAVTSFLRHGSAAGLLTGPKVSLQNGDYAIVKVTEAKGHVLRGQALWRTTLQSFSELQLPGMDSLLDEAVRRDNSSLLAA